MAFTVWRRNEKRGKIDKRTSFGQASKEEYVTDLAATWSVMLLVIVEDTVWCDFYIATYDQYLAGLKAQSERASRIRSSMLAQGWRLTGVKTSSSWGSR
jgi:hypothetical protein